MSEPKPEQNKEQAVALTTERLQVVLHEARKDEAKLRQVLEMQRLKRRQRAVGTK
ncbi:hypothetical protein R5W24_000834 [Gemmata sp. JC717]|uniref:hypothetical protein n=1 Tax=Gemmata algarum TaxID=2975278 RepID=UPI0021BB5F12|nr:hypothetical protein [Gemmata algarum]MDY3551755.1 hypothetical protein [Gemmata algarum]